MSAEPTPLVSVILPTHNRAALLRRAIESVLSQTYQKLELIVVDDCSTDGTEAVVRSFTDPRLRYIRLEQNSRAAAARNIGIREAQGELVAFQDDDDIWLSQKLARQVPALLANDDVGLNLCGKIRLYPDRAEYVGGAAAFQGLDFERRGPLEGCGLISTPCWLARREVLLKAGLFDERMRSWDDWEFGLRLFRMCRFSHLDEPLYIQDRAQGGGMWSNEKVFSNDMQVILNKHPQLWRDLRAVRSRSYYYLGRSEAMFHAIAEGRRWLARAIATNPMNVKAWVALLGSYLGQPALRTLVFAGRQFKTAR